MARNDGGPAFPGEQGHIPDGTWNQSWEPGMSLRDWFAGQALANAYTQAESDPAKAAEWAYQVADAMIRARTQENRDG